MSRESLVVILGFVVLMTPYIGLQRIYKEYIFIITGLILITIGYSLRRGRFIRSLHKNGETRGDAFVESGTTIIRTTGEKEDSRVV